MNKFKAMLWVFNPQFWVRADPTSPELTKFIHEALDKGEIPIQVNEFEIILSGMRLWGSNYPYGFGGPYDNCMHGALPSRYAVARIGKLLGLPEKKESRRQRALRITREAVSKAGSRP